MSVKAQGTEIETMGYPRIEALIESEDFDVINRSFGQSYEALEKISKQKSGLGKGKSAKKGMNAINLTMELFKELLKLKYQLMEESSQEKK